MVDIYSKAKRRALMSSVKHARTAPEEQVAALLRTLKVKYRRNVKSLPGQPDFVIGSTKTAIFVHGCFWHDHPKCKLARRPKTNRTFWEEKAIDNKRRDRRKERLLRQQGWHIMTIWQCRLRNPSRILGRLQRTLKY